MLERWTAWTKAEIWHSRTLGLVVFAIWLCLVLILVQQHAYWRDEVRVLSLATRGDLISMIESLRGEGHPALWFLLIRGAYFLVGSSAVLGIVSVSVASAAALLLVLRSPFGWPLICAVSVRSCRAVRIFGNGTQLRDRHAADVPVCCLLPAISRSQPGVGLRAVSFGEYTRAFGSHSWRVFAFLFRRRCVYPRASMDADAEDVPA